MTSCVVFFTPVDSSVAWLTEVLLLGSSDSRLAELSVNEETRTLLDLALGSSRGPAGHLWQKMEEFALSKGERVTIFYVLRTL